jgi:hypothetical protein
MTIRVDQEIFYQNVSVVSIDSDQAEELQKLEEEKNAILRNMSIEINNLKENYSKLEDKVNQKKEDGYDISRIDLTYLDKYIRDAQSGVIAGDVSGARVSLDLAKGEYFSLNTKLDNVKKLSFLNRVKTNIFLFAAMASILALVISLLNNLRIKHRLENAKNAMKRFKKPVKKK